MTDDKYASLRQALKAAHEQAAEGKGRERHARDGQPFTSQPIMAITRMVGLGYPCGQAMKKLQEAVGMAERGQHEAAQREMLGAINYAAAAWIRVGEMVGGDVGFSEDKQNTLSEYNINIERIRNVQKRRKEIKEWNDYHNETPVSWKNVSKKYKWMTQEKNGEVNVWEKKPNYCNTGKRSWLKSCEADEAKKLANLPNELSVARIWHRPIEFLSAYDDQPPVPWEYAPPRVRYFSRDANGAIDAWTGDRPVLERGAVWCGRDVDLIRWRPGDDNRHEPKIWERPAAREDEQLMTGEVRLDIERLREMCSSVEIDDQPPVPWDEVPDGFGWITRDGDGMIQAWTTVRPSLTTNAIWISGFGKYLRLRCPDGNQHEPEIWERPE